MVPEKPAVRLGEMSAAELRVVQTLLAGASAAAAVPNKTTRAEPVRVPRSA
jgi:hypothetical protein